MHLQFDVVNDDRQEVAAAQFDASGNRLIAERVSRVR